MHSDVRGRFVQPAQCSKQFDINTSIVYDECNRRQTTTASRLGSEKVLIRPIKYEHTNEPLKQSNINW